MREAYIVDKNSIRNINRIYVGVAGKARKVVKGYVGVNGKARLCFERDKEITKQPSVQLSHNAYMGASGNSSDDYALIGGGYTGSGTSSVVDAFNANLTRSLPTALSQPKIRMGSASWKNTNNNGMIFAGGEVYSNGWSYSNIVEKYDFALTKNYLSNLSNGRSYVSCASLNVSDQESQITIAGGYEATSGGGHDTVETVEMYSSRGTKSLWPSLESPKYCMGATVIPGQVGSSYPYFAFGGGSGTRGYSADLELYSGSVKVPNDGFPVTMGISAASTLGTHAIFGGQNGDVYSFNIYMVMTAALQSLSNTSYSRTAITLNDVVMFAGGGDKVEGYDENLVKTVFEPLSDDRGVGYTGSIASAKVQDTVLFSGGNYIDYVYSNGDTADVYKIDYA